MNNEEENTEINEQEEFLEYVFALKNEVVDEKIDSSRIKRIKKLPKTLPDLKVDLALKKVKVFAAVPNIKLIEAPEKEKRKGYKQVETVEFVHSFMFEKKFEFKNNTLVMDNKTYSIPSYFNLNLILNNKNDALERLFYRLLFDEIRINIKKYNAVSAERPDMTE